jgi:hypothetical protein
MPGLARHHADEPADDPGRGRINEQQGISHEKAESADQVQCLVDPALMVVAVIVPTQDFNLLEKF